MISTFMPLAEALKSSTALSRHLDRGGSRDIGVQARLIVEHANLDRAEIVRIAGARI
jgi:hypothetical protein